MGQQMNNSQPVFPLLRGFLRLLSYLFCLGALQPVQAMQVNINVFNQDVQVLSGDRPSIVDGGIVRLEDSYPEVNLFTMNELGTQGRNRRETSLFHVTLQGNRYGHIIEMRAKLGRTHYRNPSYSYQNFGDASVGRNVGCREVSPMNSVGLAGGQQMIIDPGNSDMTRDCIAQSADYVYRDFQPMQGVSREVFLDLPGLVNNDAFQQLPPDLYFANTTYTLEQWNVRETPHYYPLPLSVQIRKQAYFSGISLPSTTLPLSVLYANQTVQGNATMPIILHGAFDPHFGQVHLSAHSDNAFSLRNGDQAIPYQANVVVNQQRKPLNRDSSPATTIVLDAINNVRQIPLTLEVSFNRQRSQVNSGGRYSDRLTLIAEVSLV